MIMYYYTYYLLSIFAKRFNNRDGDYAFTAIFYFFLLVGLNVLSILLIICGKTYLKSHILFITFTSIIIPSVIHYIGLVRNKKYEKIIQIYDEKYLDRKLSRWSLALIVLYVLATLSIVIYVATLIRAQNL